MQTAWRFDVPLVRNTYQVWQNRRTGLYYGVQVVGEAAVTMTVGLERPPTAYSLPAMTFYPEADPPKLSNPTWRVIRLSVS
jgi:hypothetical protein